MPTGNRKGALMNYKRLIETLMKEDGGGMVGPVTAQDGNTSISYLPGQFSSMKNSLRSLSTYKKKWGIQVLEDKDNYTVQFESALDIIVPKSVYEEFNLKVLKVQGMKEVDLFPLIREETELVVNRNLSSVRANLLNLRNEQSFALALQSNAEWVYVFNESRIDKSQLAPINLLQYSQSINDISLRMKEIYGDDLGGVQQLGDALEDKEGLADTELFRDSEWIAASKIDSMFLGVKLSLVTRISHAFILDQYIECDDEEVLNEVAALRTVKVSKDKIYPTRLVFNPGFFDTLKKLIDDVVEMK